MKNNEIMVSARFVGSDLSEEFSFLVLKDISLRALIEAIYYGLDNLRGNAGPEQKACEAAFGLLEEYLKSRSQLQVLYNAKGDFNVIDFTSKTKDDRPIYDEQLDRLGFVTSSCLLFTMEKRVDQRALFNRAENSYILKNEDSLEYNISTRRLNVIEPSVVDILPPGEMPQKDKSSLLDVLIPTLLSTGGMLGARFLMMNLMPSSSGMGSTMLVMSAGMGIVSLVTTLYNYLKKKRDYKAEVQEWKTNYENYIARVIRTIKEWQKSDIKYLRSVYPSMDTLFARTASIDGSIFSRSQNDNDFMTISLGSSDEVKPLFEINNERKDNIFYDIKYKMYDKGNIRIFIPSKAEDKRRKALSNDEREEEDRNKFLLTDLPSVFANKGVDPQAQNKVVGFQYLRSDDGAQPPLLLNLKSSGALGVVSDNDGMSERFIRHVIFELAYYHSPEDLQFVFFFKPEQDRAKQTAVMENYRYLPHTNELLDGASQFVFDKQSAGMVFGRLLSIMNERTKDRQEEKESESAPQKLTQIVCVVFDDYKIKETGFSKYLPEVPKEGEPYVNENGLTFIFVQPHKDKLPKYCGDIVELKQLNERERKSSLRYNVLSRETLNVLSENEGDGSGAKDTNKLIEYKHFDNEFIFGDRDYSPEFSLAFRQLSGIYYTRIAENGKVPSMVTLFELYHYTPEKLAKGEVGEEILNNWKDIEKNNITRNLRVPVGKNEHGAVDLDLYEKADGPHMLVAGTTGSGKSETIITYLIGLCMKFSPLDLNLMLVDMKGGGFSDRLGNLPHCVGVVTDTAGENEGTSAAYMLKRFLESLNAEIKRRKLLLSTLGVDNVDAYIRACRSIKAIEQMEEGEKKEKAKRKLNEKQQEALAQGAASLQPLSHLVLVVDEFTELKRFSSESNDVDFIAEITTIARVGRTLGFHIILVSQNIEGAITDDIRVNSKARICLKVATKQASKEMLGSPVAAAPTMPLNGRAYLLVGTGSRFEYFQSAYTGANKDVSIDKPVHVAEVPNSGRYLTKFYDSSKNNAREIARRANVSEHDTQLAYVVNTIIELGKREDVEKPRQIFLPPLASVIVDEADWRD